MPRQCDASQRGPLNIQYRQKLPDGQFSRHHHLGTRCRGKILAQSEELGPRTRAAECDRRTLTGMDVTFS